MFWNLIKEKRSNICMGNVKKRKKSASSFKRRILCMFVVCVMMITSLPTMVFADTDHGLNPDQMDNASSERYNGEFNGEQAYINGGYNGDAPISDEEIKELDEVIGFNDTVDVIFHVGPPGVRLSGTSDPNDPLYVPVRYERSVDVDSSINDLQFEVDAMPGYVFSHWVKHSTPLMFLDVNPVVVGTAAGADETIHISGAATGSVTIASMTHEYGNPSGDPPVVITPQLATVEGPGTITVEIIEEDGEYFVRVTADGWGNGVVFRVTLERNGATIDLYIHTGNFEPDAPQPPDPPEEWLDDAPIPSLPYGEVWHFTAVFVPLPSPVVATFTCPVDSHADVTETVEYGATPTAPSWTRIGYSLTWDPVVGPITANTTFTAVWTEEDPIEVTFHLAGGNVAGNLGPITLEVEYGALASTVAPTPVKVGYSFSGWLPTPFEPVTEEDHVSEERREVKE
jgi:hypothetical protein